MPRAFLVVLDSVGCGGAPDAAAFGDEGSNTLLHIAEACARTLPNLDALGLGAAIALASDQRAPGLNAKPKGAWGAATEISQGKDTPSGHWELAGVPVPWAWHYFPDTHPAFPSELAAKVATLAGTKGVLGDCHASGTKIIDDLAAEHIETGWPICYTSADSVFQIAAHETHFGLQNLLDLCAALAPDLHQMKVGRVIARPFIGSEEDGYTRTSNRKDYAIAPPSPTLCDWVKNAGRSVYSIGKIADIFSMQGITEGKKGGDLALFDHLLNYARTAEEGALVFANFVEFDSLYGHRRDVSGYARALEWFDQALPRLTSLLGTGDLLILTADHGNDPTWRGNDHTRERVPVLIHGAGQKSIGHVGFVDVAATIAQHLDVPAQGPGRSFL
ncbi:UNVERIFIED_CONTAM: hypothetical protein GTU68_049144 [Idotea baltica]|nr:hypothetical protein [Idotea baltica]